LDGIGLSWYADRGAPLEQINKFCSAICAPFIKDKDAVMSFQPIATAYISWLSLEEGGREKPPYGTIYAATAKFAEQSDEFFSVVMRQVHQLRLTSSPEKYDLDFFAPELV
jgi:hypothetical protein